MKVIQLFSESFVRVNYCGHQLALAAALLYIFFGNPANTGRSPQPETMHLFALDVDLSGFHHEATPHLI